MTGDLLLTQLPQLF